MKIAGLLPLKYDQRKSRVGACLLDMERTCDEIILMHDNPTTGVPGDPSCITETLMVVGHRGAPWNDWVNRATLLARAAKYGCDWAMQLDDDETLGPMLTRERVRELAEEANSIGMTQVVLRVLTMWNDTHHRTDGVFSQLYKTFLLVNPFMEKGEFKWQYGPDHELHHFPTIKRDDFSNTHLILTDYVVHWGMRTPELRLANVEKYQKQDPENKLSGVRYDCLLDETGMVLESL